MRIHQVVLVVGLVVSTLGASGCAADEIESEPSASVSAPLITIKAGRASRQAGIKQWTYSSDGGTTSSFTPVSTTGKQVNPVTVEVTGKGDTKVVELRSGKSVFRVDGKGVILESSIDAETSKVLSLYQSDLETFVASDQVPYGSCTVENIKLALAIGVTAAACGTAPATAGIGCVLAVAAMLVQAHEAGVACRTAEMSIAVDESNLASVKPTLE